MPKTIMSKATFEALAVHAGLTLTAQQKRELHEAYGYVEELAARARAGDERPVEAELAVIFKPGT